ncbi:ATPase [Aureococcus anophagefferens]|nr:ATPase [Aureococcus anophagefferens]
MAASDHGGGGVAAMTVPERDGAGSGSRDIHVTDFDVYFGGSCLLRSADLHLAYRRRYGLVGPNGVGKTTLLRHMAAFDLPKFPRHLRVLHLAALGARERELSAGLEGMEPAAAVAAHAELASIAQQLESLDASTAHARASAILHGLGFSEEKQVAPLSSLSGGWRVRTALAGALFVSPDLLLLDEPTNHLDLEACIWLEHYLVHTFKHTLVLVSHDRSFLNAVCTDCVVFKDQRLVPFRGDYDAYVKARDEAAARARREYDAYVDQRAHIQEFIDKFRYNAKRASIVQSRIKTAETCAFGYGDGPSLFENVDFDVDDKSRVAIVGPNGSGKSTLLKLLLGEIKPRAGEVHRKQQLKVEFFTQHHADQLDLNLSPIENVLRRFKSASEAEVRGHLGQFMIDGDLQLKPCALMSGGQKSRVAFALLAFARRTSSSSTSRRTTSTWTPSTPWRGRSRASAAASSSSRTTSTSSPRSATRGSSARARCGASTATSTPKKKTLKDKGAT